MKKAKIQVAPQHKYLQFVTGETLNLSRKDLADNDMRDIIKFLQIYPQIRRVDLSLNNIGDEGLVYFSERNQTVREADFSGNNISDHGVALFAYKNETITQANFSHNPISDQGIDNFALINDVCNHAQFSSIRYH